MSLEIERDIPGQGDAKPVTLIFITHQATTFNTCFKIGIFHEQSKKKYFYIILCWQTRHIMKSESNMDHLFDPLQDSGTPSFLLSIHSLRPRGLWIPAVWSRMEERQRVIGWMWLVTNSVTKNKVLQWMKNNSFTFLISSDKETQHGSSGMALVTWLPGVGRWSYMWRSRVETMECLAQGGRGMCP